MNTDAPTSRDYAAGDLRASDADRDRTLAELSEHFQAGRLTADELEDRTGRALSARTGNDLAVLLADLPPARSVPAPVARPEGRGGLPTWAIVAIVAIVVSGVIAVAAPGHGHVVIFPWWLIVAAYFVLRGRRRRHHEDDAS